MVALSSSLAAYGWTPEWEAAFAAAAPDGSTPARVLQVHERLSDVVTADGERRVWNTIPGRHVRPAVGDWVAVVESGKDGEPTIGELLPRRTQVARRSRGTSRVLAANADVVIVATPLAENHDLRLLARLLAALGEERDLRVVVAATKADLRGDDDEALTGARQLAGDIRVEPLSVRTGLGLDWLHEEVGPGRTAVLFGASGAGKSTLVNHLAGADVQRTGAVTKKGAGRQTTSARRLLLLPDGGLIVDTPGVGSVAPSEPTARRVFTHLDELAQTCFFSSCGHASEEGCAVTNAIAAGELREDVWEAFIDAFE